MQGYLISTPPVGDPRTRNIEVFRETMKVAKAGVTPGHQPNNFSEAYLSVERMTGRLNLEHSCGEVRRCAERVPFPQFSARFRRLTLMGISAIGTAFREDGLMVRGHLADGWGASVRL